MPSAHLEQRPPVSWSCTPGGRAAPCVAQSGQFASFRRERRCNEHSAFLCLAASGRCCSKWLPCSFPSTLFFKLRSSPLHPRTLLRSPPAVSSHGNPLLGCSLLPQEEKKPQFLECDQGAFPLWLQRPAAPGVFVFTSRFCRQHWAKHSGCQPHGICQGTAAKISKFCVMTMLLPLLCPKNLPPPSRGRFLVLHETVS